MESSADSECGASSAFVPGGGGRSGVGLIEVVIALFVFSMSIAGMCALAVIVKESSDRARDHYVAVNLAKNRLERAKSFDFTQLYTFRESQSLVDLNGTPVSASDPRGDYRRSTIVTNVTDNLTEVRVTVEIRNRQTWEFVPGVEDIRTYVANIKAP